VKELTALGNTAAKLNKILQEVDKQNIQREKNLARGNKAELFRN
jgi:hypothetical protein